ncbi:MAG: hypothetical protein EXS35_12310 [Pedosphaera sp.]|nr:hypothetical protein [Pedosphaera sp.]
MNFWKIILATLAIFITGVVTGGLLVSYADSASQKNRRPRENVRLPANVNPALPANPREANFPRPNQQPRGLGPELVLRLDTEVHLTSGQREHIEQIIKDGQAKNKMIWDRVAPEVRREMTETQRRIREVLTPEQRAQFEELMKQSRPAVRRNNDEPIPPNQRPRDQRRPNLPRETPDFPPSAPRPNP